MATPPAYLDLAQVQGTHGIGGELKVRPDTDDPLRLRELKQVDALLADGTRQVLTIAKVTARKDGQVLVKFEGYDSPEAAAPLRRAILQVPFEQAKRKPGQVLYADVLGLMVQDEAGKPLGTVTEVLRAAQDLFEVKTPDGQEVLVPWVDVFVRRIDLEARVLVLSPPDGLF